MSDTEIQSITQLLQEARAAALAGDSYNARTLFRRATELAPGSAEAWLGLSGVTPILADKRSYLLRALELEPASDEAAASLAYVEKLIGEGMQIAPAQRLAERRSSGDASPLLGAPEPEQPAAETLHCYIHPDRETGLLCVQCGRPICGQCAQLASVGQLCPECRRARRPPNYQYTTANLIAGGLVALGVGVAGSIGVLLAASVPLVGLFLSLMAGPLIGDLAVRASDRLTRMKRGRAMQIAVGAGLALGMFPLLAFMLLRPSLMTLLALLALVLAVVNAARRLR